MAVKEAAWLLSAKYFTRIFQLPSFIETITRTNLGSITQR